MISPKKPCGMQLLTPFGGSICCMRRQPVAVAFHWEGSATFFRLQLFCSGVAEGLKDIFAKGHPLVLVNDGDIGGIIGLHFQEELQLQNPIISIDGIASERFRLHRHRRADPVIGSSSGGDQIADLPRLIAAISKGREGSPSPGLF